MSKGKGKTSVKIDPESDAGDRHVRFERLLVRCTDLGRRRHRPKKEQQADATDGRPSVGEDLLLQRLRGQIK
jgi:hypothetical protein